MAETQQAKEKTQTTQDKKNINLEEAQSTQTPASRQAEYSRISFNFLHITFCLTPI